MRRKAGVNALVTSIAVGGAVVAAMLSYSWWENRGFSGLPSDRPTRPPPYRQAPPTCSEIHRDFHLATHRQRVWQAECSFAADLLAAYIEGHGTEKNVVLAVNSLFEGLAAVALGSERGPRDQIMRALNYPYSPFRFGEDRMHNEVTRKCAEQAWQESREKEGWDSRSPPRRSEAWALWLPAPTAAFSRELQDYFARSPRAFDAGNLSAAGRSIGSWLAHESRLQNAMLAELTGSLGSEDLVLTAAYARAGKWLLEPTPGKGTFRRADGKTREVEVLKFRRFFYRQESEEYQATWLSAVGEGGLVVTFFRVGNLPSSRHETAQVLARALRDYCAPRKSASGEMLLEVPLFSASTVQELGSVLKRMGLGQALSTESEAPGSSTGGSWTVWQASRISANQKGLLGGVDRQVHGAWPTPPIKAPLSPMVLDGPFAFAVTAGMPKHMVQVGWIATPE